LVTVSVAGLPLLLAAPEHHHDCPLRISADLCESSIVDHLSLWELMLASILTLVPLFIGSFITFRYLVRHTVVLRVCFRIAAKQCHDPTLLQRLLSDGILNRKEPLWLSAVLLTFINLIWKLLKPQYLQASSAWASLHSLSARA